MTEQKASLTKHDRNPGERNGALVELRSAEVHRSGIAVLLDVSLWISPGERVAVLGPSGAGKSTLLMAIAGGICTKSGEIVRRSRGGGRLEIGYMFQDARLLPHLTVVQNLDVANIARERPSLTSVARIAFSRKHRKGIRLRSLEALASLGLVHLADRLPSEISGGQAQRVALARALTGNPDLLCLDEPFSALDGAQRDELHRLVTRTAENTGQAVLWATHDSETALRLSDRIVVVSRGRLVQTGVPDQVYHFPATVVVAKTTGRCNFLAACVSERREGWCLARIRNTGENVWFAGSHEVGESVTIAIRPERLKIQERSVAASPSLCAVVTSVREVADHFEVDVELGDASSLSIHVPFGAPVPDRGSDVLVCYLPDDLRCVLDDSQEDQ